MITEPTHPVADAAPTSCARMIRWLDHPRFVAWCLVIATGIRLAWAWRFDSTPTYDAAWYIEHGFTMLKGQFYGAWPTAYFPPGYPWFLSWCFRLPIEPMPAARLAHVALALATLWLILHVARLLFRDERVARLALLLAAAWPNGIVYGSLYMSENLFLPLMLAGVACLLHGERRWGWLIPAGLVLGLATLTRAQATLIPLVYFILTLRPALRPSAFLRWLGRAALVAALMLLTLAPLAGAQPAGTGAGGVVLDRRRQPVYRQLRRSPRDDYRHPLVAVDLRTGAARITGRRAASPTCVAGDCCGALASYRAGAM